jgi:radical SAM superfamily enzyme YgiQ (UPF0313 family)
MTHESKTLTMVRDTTLLDGAVDPFARRPPYASSQDAELRIKAVAIHTIDHFAGLPLWRFSMAFALLKTYLAKFPFHTRTSFELLDHYQTTDNARIVEATVRDQPQFVLFSVYVWNFLKYQRLAAAIKRKLPDTVIILGGPEVAEDTRQILRENPAFDIIVRGEGEHVFSELVRVFLEGGDPGSVNGITYRKGDEIIRTPDQDASILDGLDMIPSMYHDDVFEWTKLQGSYGAIETQRGCNFSCGFCRYRKIGGGARFFNVDRVLREIDILANIGVDYLYLMDPTFNNDLRRAKRILRHIIDRDMHATIFTEMVPEFMDEELIELSIRAGMKNLEVGVQSTNKPALRVMQRPRNEKKLPTQIAMAANKEIDGKRLNVIPQIIYGLPGEGLADYFRSFDFVYDLDVEEVAMYHLLVLRDTQFYRDKETHGFIYEADPPHRLIASKTFSREDVLLAAKLSCLAMATQYTLRQIIREHCRINQITPLSFFLDHVRVGDMPDELARALPIYTEEDATVLLKATEEVGRVLKEGELVHRAEKGLKLARVLFRSRPHMLQQQPY